MVRLHHGLAWRAEGDPNFHFHYVTAREMFNLARAAEADWEGSVAEARDFLFGVQTLTPRVPPDEDRPAVARRGIRIR
jgi:hypothetical protein